MRFLYAALLAAAFALAGCKGNCRQLSEKLCECKRTTIERQQCLSDVAQEEQRVQPTAADEQVCGALLNAKPGCDCHQIATVEGMRACGLAR